MPNFSVVQVTTDSVVAAIRECKTWRQWSPWLIAEPDCLLNDEEDGSGYDWEGQVFGAGKVRLLAEAPAEQLYLDLTLLKPGENGLDVNW